MTDVKQGMLTLRDAIAGMLKGEGGEALDKVREVVSTPVIALDDEEVFAYWSMCDGVAKALDRRKKQLRERLMEMASEGATDGSSNSVGVLGGTVTRQLRERVTLDASAVRALLETSGLTLGRGGRLEFVPDSEKLEDLIASGALSAEDVSSCAKVSKTYALTVKKPPFANVRLPKGKG